MRLLFPTWLRHPAFWALTALAILGNFSAVTLVFGVEFVFGSIASLILISLLGPIPGLIAAALASVYTFFLWNHFYAAVVLTGEAAFVSLFLHRFRSNLALAAGSYWVLIGLPASYSLYRLGLDIDHLGALLVGLKQAANGILNAVLASLLVTHTPLSKWVRSDGEAKVSVFQSISSIFVAAALVPACIMMVLDAHRTVDQVEKEIRSKLDTITTGISQSAERWLTQHVHALSQLALEAENTGLEDRERLNNLVRVMVKSWPDILNAYIADEEGNTLAFYPLTNAKGESTIGLNFSDRIYFQASRKGPSKINVSPVFMGRGGVFEPIINVTSRFNIDGRFAGVASAPLNLRHLGKSLAELPVDVPYFATLVDGQGQVIASSDPDREALSHFNIEENGLFEEEGGGFFHLWPKNQKLAHMSRWRHSFLGKDVQVDVRVQGANQWRLIVEAPLLPWQASLYARYVQLLSYLIVISLLILLGSLWIASRISTPLAQLSSKTTNLPERLQSNETIEWPQTRVLEIKTLTENFRITVEALKKRFQELEASRSELRRANKMKDEFLATLSHELRTPLNAILGHAGLLKEESGCSEHFAVSVDTIYRNAEAQNQMIRDLLDVSAIMAGKLSLVPSLVSPPDIVGAAVSSVDRSAKEKKIHLEADVEDTARKVYGDPTRLQQVVCNLLTNAIKFTPHEGHIKISAREREDGYEIEVVDSGQGIEPGFLPHVFERFRQEDGSLTRKYGGLGLGLSVVQQIVEQHGGKVSAFSEGTNRGSRFTIILPTVSATGEADVDLKGASPSNKKASAQTGEAPLSGLKILVVDDESDARALTARFLTLDGGKVETAVSAQDGLEKFQSFHPDVLISDIGMPGEDGYAFLRKIRSMHHGANIPAAALTAFAQESDRQRAEAAGFQAHIAKPASRKELTRIVTKLAEATSP